MLYPNGPHIWVLLVLYWKAVWLDMKPLKLFICIHCRNTLHLVLYTVLYTRFTWTWNHEATLIILLFGFYCGVVRRFFLGVNSSYSAGSFHGCAVKTYFHSVFTLLELPTQCQLQHYLLLYVRRTDSFNPWNQGSGLARNGPNATDQVHGKQACGKSRCDRRTSRQGGIMLHA